MSLCAWEVPNASEAAGYQVGVYLSGDLHSLSQFRLLLNRFFCLFYLLGEETKPTISLAPPFRVGRTVYIFLLMCIYKYVLVLGKLMQL